MKNYKVENLKLMSISRENGVFDCEDKVSFEDKIAFVDRFNDGKLSLCFGVVFALFHNLLSLFILFIGNQPELWALNHEPLSFRVLDTLAAVKALGAFLAIDNKTQIYFVSEDSADIHNSQETYRPL